MRFYDCADAAAGAEMERFRLSPEAWSVAPQLLHSEVSATNVFVVGPMRAHCQRATSSSHHCLLRGSSRSRRAKAAVGPFFWRAHDPHQSSRQLVKSDKALSCSCACNVCDNNSFSLFRLLTCWRCTRQVRVERRRAATNVARVCRSRCQHEPRRSANVSASLFGVERMQ